MVGDDDEASREPEPLDLQLEPLQPQPEPEDQQLDFAAMGTPEADTVPNSPYSTPSRLSTSLSLEWASRTPKKRNHKSPSLIGDLI